MAAQDDTRLFRLLLVGKTGEGKSSTGNSILGQKAFTTGSSSTSITSTCKKCEATVEGQKVVVVDSPGLADTELTSLENLQRLIHDIESILKLQNEGFDAILINICQGRRLTEEDVKLCRMLDLMLGPDFTQHLGILVLTHVDNYDPEEHENQACEQFMEAQTGLFKEMLEKCDNRMVLFDNRTRDETKKTEQVRRLLDMVAGMKKASRSYTSETFEKAHGSRNKLLLEIKKPLIRQETEEKLEVIMEENTSIELTSENIGKFEANIVKLEEICKDLNKQDNETGILKEVISEVSNMKEGIKPVIEALKNGHDGQLERETLIEKQKKLQRNLLIFKGVAAVLGISLGVVVGAAIGVVAAPAAAVAATTAEVAGFGATLGAGTMSNVLLIIHRLYVLMRKKKKV